jgi:hypothetical protein
VTVDGFFELKIKLSNLVLFLCANVNLKLFEMYAHFETARKSDSSFVAIEKVNT